jgi:hypothetical protein
MKVCGQLHVPAALPRDSAFDIHWTGDRMNAIVGLESVIRRQIHPPETESRFSLRPAGSLVTLQTEILFLMR